MFENVINKTKVATFFEFYKRQTSVFLSVLLFLFLFSSWMGNVILSVGDLPTYNHVFDIAFTVLRYASYLMMAAAALLNLAIRRSYSPFLFLLVGLTSVLVFLFTRSSEFAIFTLFLFAFTPLGIKRGLKIYLLVQGIILLGVPLMAAFNIFPDVIMDTVRSRHGLGFTWVTTAPVLFLFFTFGLMLDEARRLNYLTLFSLAACSVYLYVLTDTNFTFLMTFCVLLVFLLYRMRPTWFAFLRSNWFFTALCVLPVILTILALVLTLAYNPSNAVLEKMNGLLSGRLANNKTALDTYGLSLFGKPIVWHGNGPVIDPNQPYLFVDCSYLNILLNYGILELLLILAWCALLAVRAWKNRNGVMMIVLFFLFIFSFYEVRLINPLYNPLLLYASRDLARPVPEIDAKINGWFASLIQKSKDEKAAKEQKKQEEKESEQAYRSSIRNLLARTRHAEANHTAPVSTSLMEEQTAQALSDSEKAAEEPAAQNSAADIEAVDAPASQKTSSVLFALEEDEEIVREIESEKASAKTDDDQSDLAKDTSEDENSISYADPELSADKNEEAGMNSECAPSSALIEMDHVEQTVRLDDMESYKDEESDQDADRHAVNDAADNMKEEGDARE